MKKLLVSLLAVLLLLSACGSEKDTTSDLYDQLPTGGDDAATSGMVDEAFFLTGELKEIGDNSVLMDAEGVGLVWVRFDTEVNLDIPIKSIVKAQFTGELMESYPNQANGLRLEVVELFSEEALFTKDALDAILADGDVNHVIVWNENKDQVAYATVDLTTLDGSYRVFVSTIYEEGSIEVAYVKYEMPDLNWFYDSLEIQTSNGSNEVGPDFEAIEEIIMLEGTPKEESGQQAPEYTLEANTYLDEEKNIQIGYYIMSGLLGELTQDYINQSLYNIVEIYGENYTDIRIEPSILKQDEFVTIAYQGQNAAMGYPIMKFLTIDVASSDVLTMDNVMDDMDTFKALFEEKSGYNYDEQEGVYPYLEGELIVFTFVPTDDSAEREFVSFPVLELAPVLDMKFERPAS